MTLYLPETNYESSELFSPTGIAFSKPHQGLYHHTLFIFCSLPLSLLFSMIRCLLPPWLILYLQSLVSRSSVHGCRSRPSPSSRGASLSWRLLLRSCGGGQSCMVKQQCLVFHTLPQHLFISLQLTCVIRRLSEWHNFFVESQPRRTEVVWNAVAVQSDEGGGSVVNFPLLILVHLALLDRFSGLACNHARSTEEVGGHVVSVTCYLQTSNVRVFVSPYFFLLVRM